jgi:hypothetical protein
MTVHRYPLCCRTAYFCSPQHTDSAFYPLIGRMERVAGRITTARTKEGAMIDLQERGRRAPCRDAVALSTIDSQLAHTHLKART